MRFLSVILILMVVFTFENVLASSLSIDTTAVAIQGFAPDPYATASINEPSSKIFNVKGKLAWQFINTGNNNNCICRILPTKDKLKFPKFTIEAGDRPIYVVHKNTAFLNLSGCTGVLLQQ